MIKLYQTKEFGKKMLIKWPHGCAIQTKKRADWVSCGFIMSIGPELQNLCLDVSVCPHQSIDVFRLVYEHTDLFRVSTEDRLDERRLRRREETQSV